MSGLGSEGNVVQRPLARYAAATGWTYLSRDEAERLRRGETGILLHEVFTTQIQRLNPEIVDAGRAEELAKRLSRVPPTIEGNFDAWEYLRGLRTIFVEEESRERNVRVLDVDDVMRNTFHVTEEYSFTNGVWTIRGDVVLFVNGIPILIIETKAATHKKGLSEAHKQVRRYHIEAPELLAVIQLFTLTHLVRFYYGATWNLARRAILDWREEAAGNFEDLVKSFIQPTRIVRVLYDFILFAWKDQELTKVVLRPHQMRATERVVERARDTKKSRGLVWHTQGSGKTYTMLTVAKRLIEDGAFNNPTVLMLVDRNELEAQLFDNLGATGFGNALVAETKKHLRDLLRADHRGVIVSTIHKFDKMAADVMTRENVFVLVDEAHRTTGGDLGNYVMGALPNATFIGFTGTPIGHGSTDTGTFQTFGIDDPETGYLDKYSIQESIADGATVPLHYALAENDLRVDAETLENEFFSLAELEGVSDIEELNRVLEGAVTLKNMLKNHERVDHVAKYIAEHYRQNVEPMGFKAFVVAVDREACALYKEALDRYLPSEYSEVVISTGHNDEPELKRFARAEEEEQRLRRAFRKPESVPKLLIVTEKLLTGFDAPVLYAMYLDKPMRDHVLLQAIARVNRPFDDDDGRGKSCGLVLDFVGIFEKLERALAFDASDISEVVTDLGLLFDRFEELMRIGRERYLVLVSGPTDDKTVEAVLDHFRDSERREEFYAFFRELENLYEVLSPDSRLREDVDAFADLGAMYRLLRASYETGVDLEGEFLRKTERLVQEHTQTGAVVDPREIYELGKDALERIAEEGRPDTLTVMNLIKGLEHLVATEGSSAPYLIPIGERAQEIAEAFGERQVATQAALEELQRLVGEAKDAREAQRRTELDVDAFTVFWLLERRGLKDAMKVAQAVDEAMVAQPHWRESETQERAVRRVLYRALLGADADDVTGLADWLLDVLRRTGR
jgi:type I restriction enzyme R subunit